MPERLRGVALVVAQLPVVLEQVDGVRLAVDYDPAKPTIKTRIVLDCSKALLELGWRPATSLESGLARTIDWWRQNVRGTA